MNASNAIWAWPWWQQIALAAIALFDALMLRWYGKYLLRWEPRYKHLLAERAPRMVEDLYWDLLRARDAKLAQRLAARRAQEISAHADVDAAALDRILRDLRPSAH